MTLAIALLRARAVMVRLGTRPLDTANEDDAYHLARWILDTLGGDTPCGWDEIAWRNTGHGHLVVIPQQIDLDVEITPDEARWMAASLLRAADNAEAR